MTQLALSVARSAVEAALGEAASRGLNVSVSICDGQSREVMSVRGDGAAWPTHEIARLKAKTAAAFVQDSAELAGLKERSPEVFTIAGDPLPFRVTTLAGGLVIAVGGAALAAVGVSGGTAAQDSDIAESARAVLIAALNAGESDLARRSDSGESYDPAFPHRR